MIQINAEEAQELLELLTVAEYDIVALLAYSGDEEEIEAYQEVKRKMQKWIMRLRQAGIASDVIT